MLMPQVYIPEKVIPDDDSFTRLSAWLKKSPYTSYTILCDSNTRRHCLPVLLRRCVILKNCSIIEIPPGEANKTAEMAMKVCEALLLAQADRYSLIINLGGGVVTDLGGFCASIYKRGVDFIHLPTSVLAMADASIGGKNGVDLQNVRNVIGTFSTPNAVFVVPAFLKTLPVVEHKAGLAEIYKAALVADGNLWKALKRQNEIYDRNILKSIQIKQKIVKNDPFESGRRKVLNFGHSVAHALEGTALEHGASISHGEAVAAGMIMETHIAWQKKYITAKALEEISETLVNALQVPDITQYGPDDIIRFMANDKKNRGGEMLFALINGIGSCTYDIVVSKSELNKSIRHYNSLLKW
jgi:3-dehydroquinate synthase